MDGASNRGGLWSHHEGNGTEILVYTNCDVRRTAILTAKGVGDTLCVEVVCWL